MTVGPVIFSNDTAREQLENHGRVITFRTQDRTTGETWWRKSRTGEKEGDVVIEQLEHVLPWDASDLDPHVHLSGFESIQQWQDAIQDVHGDDKAGYVYLVREVDDT